MPFITSGRRSPVGADGAHSSDIGTLGGVLSGKSPESSSDRHFKWGLRHLGDGCETTPWTTFSTRSRGPPIVQLGVSQVRHRPTRSPFGLWMPICAPDVALRVERRAPRRARAPRHIVDELVERDPRLVVVRHHHDTRRRRRRSRRPARRASRGAVERARASRRRERRCACTRRRSARARPTRRASPTRGSS